MQLIVLQAIRLETAVIHNLAITIFLEAKLSQIWCAFRFGEGGLHTLVY
jgi:hypothetical protein